ncbi:MAG: ribonuclease III domain-containing protein, partial [Pseudomonadota bacterium]
MTDDLQTLCQKLGYEFGDKALLRQALTHKSAGPSHYQRLEFLGDRVMGLIVAETLMARFARSQEGELTKRFVRLVDQSFLADVARQLQLDTMVIVGAPERDQDLPNNPAILADVVEAIIAALYCDGGMEAARGFI